MKGLKKLALTSAILAISTGALAMEAMQDDALSSTTGQAGLTILIDNIGAKVAQVRYYDSDGTAGAAGALGVTDNTDLIPAGPGAGQTPLAFTNSFSAGGSLVMNGFALSATSISTSIDVGSAGTGTGAVSGLLIGTSITGLNVNLGTISFDNGDELGPVGGHAATNSAGYTSGYLSSGSDIGGVAITGLTLSNFAMLVTAGTQHFGSSGLTINPLTAINLSLTASYYNSTMESFGPSGFTPNAANGDVAGDGLISMPIYVTNLVGGPIEVAAGKDSSGYGLAAGQGLEIATNGFAATSIDIGGQGQATPGSGILIAGTNAGSIGLVGLQISPNQIYVSGH